MYEGYLRFWIAATTFYGGLGGCAGNSSAASDASDHATVTENCGSQEERFSAGGAAFNCGSQRLTAFGSAGLLAQNAPADASPSGQSRRRPSTACMATAGSFAGSVGTAASGPGKPASNPDADRAIQDACRALPPAKRRDAGCP
jgi:hypothetical protein